MTNLRELAKAAKAADANPDLGAFKDAYRHFQTAATPAAISALYAELDEAKQRVDDYRSIEAERRKRQRAAEASLSEKEREVERLLNALEQALDDMRHGLTVAPATHALALHAYATTGGTDLEILQGHSAAKAMLTDLGYLRAATLTQEPAP